MAKEVHDINEPGVWRSRDKSSSSGTSSPPPPAPVSDEIPKKEDPHFRITSLEIEEPEDGFQHNRPFTVAGAVDWIRIRKANASVFIEPFGLYNGIVDNFLPGGVKAEIQRDGTFRAEIKRLFEPDNWAREKDKPKDARWQLFVRADASVAESSFESPKLTFPRQPKTLVSLRRGHYDDNGAQEYKKQKDAEDYVSGSRVLKLQKNLNSFNYNAGEPDGFFGEQTEKALTLFQKHAIANKRMKRKLGKLNKSTTTLDQESADGIAGPKTLEEIDRWKQEDWVCPAPILRHGDYDDAGSGSGKGQKGGENHHIETPVKEMQKRLTDRGFTEVGKDDGWFYDFTKDGVFEFQTCATESTRIVAGQLTEVDVTFTGEPNGIFDQATAQELERWEENEHTAPERIPDDAVLGYLPGENKYFVVRAEHTDVLIEEMQVLNEFAQLIADTHESVQNGSESAETLEKTKKLQDEAAKLFEGLDTNPGDAIEEMVLLQKNPKLEKAGAGGYSYIRKYKRKNGQVKGHLRKISTPSVKKKIRELLDPPADKSKNKIDTELKATLWKTGEFEANWPDIWKYKGDHKAAKELADGDYFACTAAAQWMRFTAGAGLDSSFSLKNKELVCKLHGNVEYVLGEGKINGKLTLPDKDGADLFALLNLGLEAKDALTKAERECRFRIAIDITGFVLAGASISGSLAIPNISFKEPDKPDMSVDGGVSAFLGGGAGGKVVPSFDWAPDKTDFGTLAGLEFLGEGNIGAGGEFKFKIGLEGGTFKMYIAARAVVGLGARGKVGAALGVHEAFELIAHILYSVEYHKIKDIESPAFKRFAALSFATFLSPGAAAIGMLWNLADRVLDLKGWIGKLRSDPDQAAVEKEKIRESLKDKEKLRAAPPETLGALLQAIMETPEDKDYGDIITVLEAVDSEHEMAWVLRELTNLPTATDSQKGDALLAGLRTLLTFGGWNEEIEGADPSAENFNLPYLQEIFRVMADPAHKIEHGYHI